MLEELVKEDFRLFGQYYKQHGSVFKRYLAVAKPSPIPYGVEEMFDEVVLNTWMHKNTKIILYPSDAIDFIEIMYIDALEEYLDWIDGKPTAFIHYNTLMETLRKLDRTLSEKEKRDLYEDVFLKIRNDIEKGFVKWVR